eukprot:gnl/TRDRNA2_/TRDRNA2_35545_c0_seq1.p1 gnl/TRDRNA2_/TRDRNA2_35545_c0~~gnl/TRDRNA2_/TRDRNA2_35545_c0_seq1.p1  ORF type:complete len:515 (+),score=116.62 gnl/TRDRNA2_/TRDRNA2_35545_c0_seq1:65-1609(+)
MAWEGFNVEVTGDDFSAVLGEGGSEATYGDGKTGGGGKKGGKKGGKDWGGYSGGKGWDNSGGKGWNNSGGKGWNNFGGKGWNKGDGGKGAKGKAEPVPGANVFVFHLPNDWDDEKLERHFQHYGKIINQKVMQKPDGSESRGFGFVSYEDLASARRAILGMHGFPAAPGKFLKVQPKQGEEHLVPPIPDIYPPAGRIDATLTGVKPAPGSTVFIFHLPQSWDEPTLHRHFIHYGSIASLTIPRKKDWSESSGYAFLSFDHVASAVRAVDGMHGFMASENKFLKVQIKQGEEEAAKEQFNALLAAAENGQTAATMDETATAPAASNASAKTPAPAAADAATLEALAAAGLSPDLLAQLNLSNLNDLSALGIDVNALLGLGPGAAAGKGGAAVDLSNIQVPDNIPRDSSKVAPGANLYLFHLPNTWNEANLMEHFGIYGNVVSVTLARNQDGTPRGYGFVGYDDPNSANMAIEALNGLPVDGKKILVQLKDESSKGKGKKGKDKGKDKGKKGWAPY